MADPFIAEIRIFPFNFAPKGWAWCNGQLMPISQNTALFSLLGTVYGGDGKSTFALPNLQGSAPMQPDTNNGQGPGLSHHDLGETGGASAVTLLTSEMPIHTHTLRGYNDVGEDRIPGPTESLARSTGGLLYAVPGNTQSMAFESLPPQGGSLPHNNMMPYLTCYFNIALQGVYPPRQ